MLSEERRERSETESATDIGSEANGLELCICSVSVQVEYYRSVEYSVKWERPMHTRHSSRLSRAAKKSLHKSPSTDEDFVQRKVRSKRQRRTEATEVNTGKGSKRDIIDVINDRQDEKPVYEEDELKTVEIADKGLDESDEDCASVTSSVASGPSIFHHTTSNEGIPLQDLCAACQKLFQRAKRMKAPIKDKLLDNDPKSLICDQWVLNKKWRRRRLPYATGKRLIHVKVLQKRQLKKGAKRREQPVREGGPAACSRPHAFLQRNLRRCIKEPVQKERKTKRRKRTSDDSHRYRVAKQQRLLSNTHHQQHIDNTCTYSHPGSSHSSSLGYESCSDQETQIQADTDQTVDVIPGTVSVETTNPRELPPVQTPKKKKPGLRDLLVLLRGNSSIIRETR
ncbi:hypothetical protein INR49_000350 [Caranx melampygus]|nr:hypothetical protein INR49_000350 [Caranx melampygus]